MRGDDAPDVTPTPSATRCATSHQPLELAPQPAGDRRPRPRSAPPRSAPSVADAVANAFGDAPDEQLLRRIVERGYLDPTAATSSAADELHVSRATYFRRLRIASQRVADYVIAKHA